MFIVLVLFYWSFSRPRLIDYQRGEEGASLVNFAVPYIEVGELQPLLDPTLLNAYNDPTVFERQSMLDMGSLAILCLTKQSKARPSMKEVWKELESISFISLILSNSPTACTLHLKRLKVSFPNLALLMLQW
jgi:hypothetical protein